MRIRILSGVLLIALFATVSVAWVSHSSPLPAKDQVEDVILTYAWSMDEPDQATWLSVFSDDLESYTVNMYGVPFPVLQIPVLPSDPLYPFIGSLSAKQQLAFLCDMMIFDRIVVGQSSLSNIMVNVKGHSASGRDYFSHWEIVDPLHSANIAQGLDGDHWYFQEGKHWYDLEKEGADWKIVKFEGLLLRSEARMRQ